MYDGKTQLLVANPIDRYLLNSTMEDGVVKGDDGAGTEGERDTLGCNDSGKAMTFPPSWLIPNQVSSSGTIERNTVAARTRA